MARTKHRSSSKNGSKVADSSTSKATKTKKEVRVSSSTRAGLNFPVGRIDRKLRKRMIGKRVSPKASVFLAAVLEYLTTEVMELGGMVSKTYKKNRVSPRHLQLAVRGDEEFDELFKKSTIAEGGVLPKAVHPSLMPKKQFKCVIAYRLAQW
ncbi:unnamed protein product [Caenorhabditis sp. 36 PRJEB53466]|nr:unnamed protein product [Caenorhabditis sp. 36 PRJEB53466]